MKNSEEISKREKSAAVVLVISFVAMIAIVGMITFSQYQRKMEGQQFAEKNTTEEKDQNEDQNHVLEENQQFQEETSQASNTESIVAKTETPVVSETPVTEILSESVSKNAVTFSLSEVLGWPVDGNVILSYSMDETVYFSTLDQYKYNPAIIISGEVGGEVLAAADGTIEKIEVDAQTGTTITMNLGDGYEAVYGQLKEVSFEEGDYVEKGEILGYLSEPTKYYSVEGPNLYFELRKDGKPVNPMEYMES